MVEEIKDIFQVILRGDEKVIIIYSIENDYFEQEIATYNKSNNRFYVDKFTYIDTNAKFIAWYKTINYKKD